MPVGGNRIQASFARNSSQAMAEMLGISAPAVVSAAGPQDAGLNQGSFIESHARPANLLDAASPVQKAYERSSWSISMPVPMNNLQAL